MRKKELSNEEFGRVRELREDGYSWLKIQEKTGIERRLAQRAYNDWLKSRSLDELRQARVNMATQAFSEHVDSLARLAQWLISQLDLARSCRERRSADDVLDGVWETNILGEAYELPSPDPERKRRHNRRHNLRLLESLQVHTQGKIRWQALNEWQRAWDNCRRFLDELKAKERQAIDDILSQESDIQDLITKLGQGQDTSRFLTYIALEEIWQRIRSNQFDPDHPKVSITHEQVARRVPPPAEDESIKKLVGICQRVAGILLQEPTVSLVKQLHAEAQRMRKAIEELEETLDTLVLRPMILLTPRCRLCPA